MSQKAKQSRGRGARGAPTLDPRVAAALRSALGQKGPTNVRIMLAPSPAPRPPPLSPAAAKDPPPAAAAQAVVRYEESRQKMKGKKKEKKGKRSGVWDFLGSAVKNVASLLPALIPLFLTQHAPTALAASMNPAALKRAGCAAAPTAAVGAAQPLAIPNSIGGHVGIQSVTTRAAEGGSYMRIKGMDYLQQAQALGTEVQGTIMESISLNPTNGQLGTTRLAEFARSFAQYSVIDLSVLYEPNVPATQAGMLIGYVDPDPADTNPASGLSAVQKASATAGSDCWNVWNVGCVNYVGDAVKAPLYTDAEGSDVRLTDAGVFRLVSNSSQTAGTLGALYILYDVEFFIAKISEHTYEPGGVWEASLTVAPAGQSAILPFGNGGPIPNALNPFSTMTLRQRQLPAAGVALYGFPLGQYLAYIQLKATAVAPGLTWSVGGDVALGTGAQVYPTADSVNFKMACTAFFTSGGNATSNDYLSFVAANTPNDVSATNPLVMRIFALPGGVTLGVSGPRSPLQKFLDKPERKRTAQDFQRALESLARMTMEDEDDDSDDDIETCGTTAPPVERAIACQLLRCCKR